MVKSRLFSFITVGPVLKCFGCELPLSTIAVVYKGIILSVERQSVDRGANRPGMTAGAEGFPRGLVTDLPPQAVSPGVAAVH